jgi:hypothetical protein
MENGRIAEAREVLDYWLDLDRANLARRTTVTLSYVMPQSYETNSVSWVNRTASRTFGKRYANASEEQLRSSVRNLHAPLLWLARVLMAKGDPLGAALTAMLMRHLDSGPLDFFDIARELSHMAGRPIPIRTSLDELYSEVDDWIAGVRQRLQGLPGARVEEEPKS